MFTDTFATGHNMADNATLSSRLHRLSNPDVPTDAIIDEILSQHFNDPNYDLNEAPRIPRHGSIFKGPLTPNTTHASEQDAHHLKHEISPSDFPIVPGDGTESIELSKVPRAPGGYKEHVVESQYTLQDTASTMPILQGGRRPSVQTGTTTVDAAVHDDEPPYPEARAAVSNTDDPNLPVNTFRMWFLGILFAATIAGLNQLFSMRFPSLAITGIVVTILALPMGKTLEWTLPTTSVVIFGYRFDTLNPGPFNVKEHVCISAMSNVVSAGVYATDIIAVQRIFYGQQPSCAYQILIMLGTQLLGFGMAGALRQFTVYPGSMIWPSALVNSALFNTLHKNYGKIEKRHMSRERFFVLVATGAFVWYWFPGYIITALSMFNWVCWILPKNAVVNALFGTNTGLGMSMLTFDWSMIAFFSSPLVTPWWSTANTGAAFVVFLWIITPIIYFHAHLRPFTYDNTGLPYDATLILTNGTFDQVKFEAYSSMFLPASLIVAYGVAFASFTALIMHTLLWQRKDIVRRFRNTINDEPDCHSRMMRSYSAVPSWWYQLLSAVSLLLILVGIEIFPTNLPSWGGILAALLAFLTSVPIAMIQAITNQQVSLNVIYGLLAGYLWPGRPLANMVFKTIGFIGTNQAVGFAGNLKLGHYMKVPPRTMFSVQVVAAVVGVLMSVMIQESLFTFIPDLCSPTQASGYICPSTTGLGTSSIIMGGIGPARLFGAASPGGVSYSPLLWAFLLGGLAPIPFYILARKQPLSIWRYINMPIFFSGIGFMPSATGINYASWLLTGFIFQYYIRKKYFMRWMRYNYILSAGLDAGTALAIVAIFFLLALPVVGGVQFQWWGNTVWQQTADAMAIPAMMLGEGEVFGPAVAAVGLRPESLGVSSVPY
ncbi:OPT oligopeptide transporter protein-domain-containing protein [Pterulicium gracile]|uniref:OPT oligopeptide transporter protein-domain-containing protein n=1 Tax=Pterulicium gracile TaxID=1884261 RepID=A0A5C3Q4L2_9AGAR|nr:OPT oligopeptide transporter protein-domain-containing protein [Pterula gracilis]